MADNSNEQKVSSKLPRIPKLNQGTNSMIKLPTLGSRNGVKSSATNAKVEVPAAVEEPAPAEEVAEAPEGEATQALIAPSEEDIKRSVEAMRLGGASGLSTKNDLENSSNSSSNGGLSFGPGLSFPVISSLPSFGVGDNSGKLQGPSQSELPAQNMRESALPAAMPAGDNALSSSQGIEQEFSGPEFGGAASELGEFDYEGDEGDDAGEKTQMLDSAGDDDLDDIGGEKTQISMSSMDYDPLSGKLIVESGKTNQREYILVREKTSIGRAPDNDIVISDISMSRRHVEIDKYPEGFRLRDLESGNGTVLNGYRIKVGQLRDGDSIEIGSIRFRFEQTGGDPDVLWKGEAKVEYHPNQKRGGGPKIQPAAQVSPSQQMSASPSVPQQRPLQMESMLERQGGGIAAPSWAGASPMTSPYMTAFGPNALRNVNTTPMWANIVLVALIIICLGSVVWCLFVFVSKGNLKKEHERQMTVVAQIEKEFRASVDAYSIRTFDDAAKKLQSALAKDTEADPLIKDKTVFENYMKLYRQEEDLYKQISDIRNKMNVSIPEIEANIEFLKNNVPDDSVNKIAAKKALDYELKLYNTKLIDESRALIAADKLAEANELLVKLSVLPNSEAEIQTLKKLISSKEKNKN